MKRFVAGLIALIVAACGTAQSIQWRYDVPDTDEVRCIRLASGEFAAATFEQTQGSDRLVVRIVSAGGTLVRKIVVFEEYPRRDFTIEGICADSNRVSVAMRYRELSNGSYWGALGSCSIDGTSKWWFQTGTYLPRNIVTKGGILYVAGDHQPLPSSDDRAYVSKYDAATASPLGTRVYSNVPSYGSDIALGPGNIIYLAGKQDSASAPIFIARLRDDLSPVFFTTFNVVPQEWHVPVKLGFDAASSKVFLAGWISVFPFEGSLFIASALTTTGAPTGTRAVDLGGGEDYFYGFVVGGGACYLYGFASNGPYIHKFDTALNPGWSRQLSYNAMPNALALGSFGDIFVGRVNSNDINSVVERRSTTTGDVLWTSTMPVDERGAPHGLIPDSAGNVFEWGAAGESFSAPDSYLLKHRPATLSFPATTIVGGAAMIGTITLTGPAPVGGTSFALTSSNPTVLQVPSNVMVPAGLTTITFNLTSTPVTANASVLVSASASGAILQQTLTVLAPQISSVTISPSSVTGGVGTTGTATLTGKAAVGGKVVSLSSGHVAAVVAPTVTVPAGQTSSLFGISTNPVLINTGVVISATTGSVTKTAFMAVNAPFLNGFSILPTTVVGGQPITLTLTLNGAAPSGYVVQLVSGAPGLVILPSSTAMNVGSATKNLSVNTTAVTTSITITLMAHRGAYVRTATVILTP